MVLKLIGVNPFAPFAPILSNMPVKNVGKNYVKIQLSRTFAILWYWGKSVLKNSNILIT